MKPTLTLTLLMGLVIITCLSACDISLGGDVIPSISTQSIPTALPPTASGPVYPFVPPDPQQGQAVYTLKCAPCHGDAGLGDGPQASKLPNPVAAIGRPEVARQSIPAEWFSIVTQGNQAHFMMPFGLSLSDHERWDILAYVYTLSTPPDVLAAGRDIYTASCTGCHNKKTNAGASPSPQSSDLANQERMASLSEADLYQTITNGKLPNMPAYGSSLSEAQRWAVTGYLRAMTFTTLDVAYPAPGQETSNLAAAAVTTTLAAAYPAPAAASAYPAPTATTSLTPEANTTGTHQASTIGSVNGKIMPPAGSVLPASLTVMLVGFDNNQVVLSQTAESQADGSFQFNDVDMPTGRVFMTGVIYGNNEFDSDSATITDSRILNLSIQLYQTTTDKTSLVSESTHILFDFSQPGIVQVVELFVITNPTDKMIVAAQPGQPVLEFTVPAGYSSLQVNEGDIGQRYILTANGIGDTAGIKPGARQTQVGFAFNLPYTNKLDLTIPMPLLSKVVTFMLPTAAVKLQSSQLISAGQQSTQGMTLYLYTSSNVPAGTAINVSLSGKPSGTATSNGSGIGASTWFGAGIFIITLAVAGFFVLRFRRVQPPALPTKNEETEMPDDADSLIDAIAALDDIHAVGELPEAAYQQRRAELKNKLAELFQQQENQG